MKVLNVKQVEGITLVELMILSSIGAILFMIIAQNFFDINNESKQIKVQQNLRSIQGAINVYHKDTNRFLANNFGLQTLIENSDEDPLWNGPYINKELLTDPWNRAYLYESNFQAYRIFTFGQDGKQGGSESDEDISIWRVIE